MIRTAVNPPSFFVREAISYANLVQIALVCV